MIVPSLLVIGANGGTGRAFIRAAAEAAPETRVHAFLRTPSKLPTEMTGMCSSVIRGDATDAGDVARALRDSRASVVILAVGTEHLRHTTLRETCGRVLVEAVAPGREFERVRVVVVSALGASGTKIELDWFLGGVVGGLAQWVIKHPLADHSRQEAAMWEQMGDAGRRRMLVLHPVGLTNGPATGRVQAFWKGESAKSITISRMDMAYWTIDAIRDNLCPWFGGSVGLSTKPA